jgi:group I intron endonuclease
MQSIPTESGIYQILCVPTGKIYIGSAVNLARRWKDHLIVLRKSMHTNPHLQRAWNKYGEEGFRFSVLELVEPSELLKAEQKWIDSTECTDDRIGFNVHAIAGSALGVKRRNESRQKLSAAKSQKWEGFIDPSGNAVTIINLWSFCRENDLSFGAMHNLATGKGKIRSYKGWKHVNSPYKRWFSVKYEGFIDPDGHPIPPIEDMVRFCREHDLNETHMYAVYKGRRRIHKGWTCQRSRGVVDE